MAVDWLKIKTEYINGNVALRPLAVKHGVSYSQIAKVAATEKWNDLRESQRIKAESKTNQKILEKTSEALSEEAAAKVRIKASMMRLAEGWFVQQEAYIAENPEKRGINPSDFRKMVQSCAELGIMDITDADSNESDGLLEALSGNAETLFSGGDDSYMLPEDDL